MEIVEHAEQCAQQRFGGRGGHALAGVDAGLQRGAGDVVLDDDEGGVGAKLGNVGGREGALAVGGEELVAARDAGVVQGGEHLGLALEQLHDLPVAHAGDGELLEDDGLNSWLGEGGRQLSGGELRRLAIARALLHDAPLMLLDEPTQGMGHEDVDRVMQLIKKVSANRTILMVEHNMKVVAGISDTLTVLARGAVLAEGPYAEVAANPLVIEAYMGSASVELKGAH